MSENRPSIECAERAGGENRRARYEMPQLAVMTRRQRNARAVARRVPDGGEQEVMVGRARQGRLAIRIKRVGRQQFGAGLKDGFVQRELAVIGGFGTADGPAAHSPTPL